MAARLRPMNLAGNTHDTDDNFCSGDKCLIENRPKA